MKKRSEKKRQRIITTILLIGIATLASCSTTPAIQQVYLPPVPEFELLAQRIPSVDEELKMNLSDKAWRWMNMREKVFSENMADSLAWMEASRKSGSLPPSPMLAYAPARQGTIDLELKKLSEEAQNWLEERERIYLKNQAKALAWMETVRRANKR